MVQHKCSLSKRYVQENEQFPWYTKKRETKNKQMKEKTNIIEQAVWPVLRLGV